MDWLFVFQHSEEVDQWHMAPHSLKKSFKRHSILIWSNHGSKLLTPKNRKSHTTKRYKLYHHDKIFMAYRLFSTIEFASKTNQWARNCSVIVKCILNSPYYWIVTLPGLILPNAVGVSDQVNVCFCVFFPSLSVMILMSSRHKISSPLGKVAIVGSKCRPVENSSVCVPVLVYIKK